MPLTLTTSTTWVCPAGVTNIQVECWGAGGGASGNSTAITGSVRGGSGGGGGSYVRLNTYAPTPGDSYDVNIGAAGNGGTCSPTSPTNGTDGGNTTFVHSASVIAGAAGGHFGTYNGAGGQGGNRSDAGAGYSGADDSHFGGSGAAGTTTTYPTLPNGGGGGSSGAFSASGVAASGVTGGTVSGGGSGGNGASSTTSAPSASSIPGGGGAGGSGGSVAGSGSNGQIVLTLTYTVSASDSVALSEVVANIKEAAPTDNLHIGESIFFQAISVLADTTIVSELVVTQLYSFVSDSLTVTESVLSSNRTSDTCAVGESVSSVKINVRSLSESLTIGETVLRVVLPINEMVTVGETVIGTKTNGVGESLSVSETVSYSGSTFNLHVIDSLIIGDFVASIRTLTNDCQDTFNPDPSLGKRTTTTLSYPVGVSPTITVNLRNPKFGNKQTLQNGREIRINRGGDQIINDSPYWLNLTYLQMDFESLNLAQAEGLLNILEESAGDEIQLVDWEGRTWTGFIVNDPIDVIVQMDSGCEYNASLKFEGNLV